jgi:RNA polymerase sigma-70 factor (ECF subfamily)
MPAARTGRLRCRQVPPALTGSAMNGEEDRLIAAVRSGEAEAFRHLVDMHRDMLYGTLVRLVSDRDLAEELAQETFVRAYSQLDTFRGEARFGTWLVQIGIHLARDHQRCCRRRRSTESLEARVARLGDADVDLRGRPEDDPEHILARKEEQQRVLGALARLPARDRLVLVLKYYRGLSYTEIARLVGGTPSALKVRAHRARSQLRDDLHATYGTAAMP